MNVVAITRTVKPGLEPEFEARINEFFQDALEQEGTTGASLIRPVEGSGSSEYGILRTFVDERARDAFYDSDTYRRWNESIANLVEGEAERHELHGLEAFFRGRAAPPAWKMAGLTWLAVNPAVWLSSTAIHAVFGRLPMLADLLLVNAMVVAILTWAFMPVLTRLFRPWIS